MLIDFPTQLDPIVLSLVVPLAILFLISGLDDLVIDFAWLYAWIEYRIATRRQSRQLRLNLTERPIAILVPLWHEHEVIGRMLEHNLATLRYTNYHFFVGVYPNDHRTKNAVAAAAARFPQVHMAVCPHDGPTSKADCLNWIYQHIALYEETHQVKFEVIVTHDAEDIIHPEELTWVNYYTSRYDFVQIPVFGLPTPFTDFTHGVYCDEFAESHSRDMVVRSRFRAFVPGAGVGTGYRREALEKLAASEANRIFEPGALTEDYENGLRLKRLGCTQVFASPWRVGGPGSDFVATREYFPRNWTAALRQRSRWVTGIALQSWEHFGWGRTPGEKYWFWRDRKSLIACPLGVVANVLSIYGLLTSIWLRMSPFALRLTMVTLALQIIRILVRMAAVARIYSFAFSLGVPLRIFYANALNAAATLSAMMRFAKAKLRDQPLRWLKTEHSYPTRTALLVHKQKLGEILVGSGYIDQPTLEAALALRADGVRLGEQLMAMGALTEDELYEALSLQLNVPFTRVFAQEIEPEVARTLPRRVLRQWKVLPFKLAEGSLHIASSDVPADELGETLRCFTSLEIQFHLVTPADYAELREALR